ncbi:MAG: hypothetical protein QHH75_10045 [Bacillota bacterium]|nr:hypothetical protein [Bacillota bacterium]
MRERDLGGLKAGLACAPERGEVPQGELRCVCNRLICVVAGDVIEIKCSKCKRLVRIETAGIKGVHFC